jgi:hypothetical protein
VTARWLVVPLLAVALCGCSGDSGPQGIEAGRLADLVLQPADLSSRFDQFDEGRLGATEITSAERADPARFCRIDGWKARYRRAGTPTTRGPLVVESRVDLFEERDGAVKDLTAYGKELEHGVWEGRALTLGGLGEAALGVTFVENRVRFFRVAWRFENATALLFANGFDRLFELEDVLELARRQQARLERAG